MTFLDKFEKPWAIAQSHPSTGKRFSSLFHDKGKQFPDAIRFCDFFFTAIN
ncbi:MAG: hypothetical protein GWP19_06575 [Planctomycetia bacterium]|nr:hypothetical protein [Planctomycetia bacterium]